MARKSRDLRRQQTENIIQAYEDAGLGKDRNCKFARDMLQRLAGSASLSTKQRAWLDSIIEKGVPLLKNKELVNQLMAAANLKGMEKRREVLTDFASKLGRGWDLSKKQTVWLNSMLAEAADIRKNGPWIPDEKLKAKMQIAIIIGQGRDGWFFAHRTGTYKAHNIVAKWLADPENSYIDQWSCNQLLKAYKATFRELENPKHLPGELRYFRGNAALIAELPYVRRGKIFYPAMVGGFMLDLPAKEIGKRGPRKVNPGDTPKTNYRAPVNLFNEGHRHHEQLYSESLPLRKLGLSASC